MYGLYILQNQWLMLAVLGAVPVGVTIALYYLAYWRGRPAGARAAPPGSRWRGAFRFIPLFLILTYLFTLIFGIAYVLTMARHPPNW